MKSILSDLFSLLPCVWIGQSIYVSAYWSTWMMMTGCSFPFQVMTRQKGSQEIQQTHMNAKARKQSCKKAKVKTWLRPPAHGKSFGREGQHHPGTMHAGWPGLNVQGPVNCNLTLVESQEFLKVGIWWRLWDNSRFKVLQPSALKILELLTTLQRRPVSHFICFVVHLLCYRLLTFLAFIFIPKVAWSNTV